MAAGFLLLSPLIIYSFYLVLTVRLYYGVEALGEVREISMRFDPATGALLFGDTSAYVVFARNMALPFASYLILLKGGRWWSFLPLGFCALMASQTGGRWELVVSVFVAIGLILYFGRRLLPQAWHCLMLVPIAIVFIGLGQNRSLIGELLTTGQFDVKFDLASSSFGEHPDFANFEFLTYVVGKVPEVSRTWSYFTQYLGLFTQPIPRILWPDKPAIAPIMLINLQAYGRFASRTISLVGDGWMSFGYAGVVVTLAAVGAFYGGLYRRFCRSGISVYFFCAYFWMLSLLIQWARDGGTKIFDFFFFCLTPLLLAMWLRRFFSRRPAGRPLQAVARDRTDSVARS
jgi:hypothetical protein